MYCLDTDIIIEYFKGNAAIKSHIDNLDKSGLNITPLTLCELYRGAFLSQNFERNAVAINKLLAWVNILDFDAFSCELYGKIYAELTRTGSIIQDSDMMIAAICKTNNKILITRNKKHFEKIKDLKLIVW